MPALRNQLTQVLVPLQSVTILQHPVVLCRSEFRFLLAIYVKLRLILTTPPYYKSHYTFIPNIPSSGVKVVWLRNLLFCLFFIVIASGYTLFVTCWSHVSVRCGVLLVCWSFLGSSCGSLRSVCFLWISSTLLGDSLLRFLTLWKTVVKKTLMAELQKKQQILNVT